MNSAFQRCRRVNRETPCVLLCPQVIITCRTEYLDGKSSYPSLFVPNALDSAKSSRFTELYVRQFDTS